MSDKNNGKLSEKLNLTNEYFRDKKVSLVKRGVKRAVYFLVNKKNEKHIAKKINNTKDLSSTNINDIISQNFITSMGYNFVPKIISYDSEHDIHIESFVGDRNIPLKDLGKKQLDIFAKQLSVIHKLPIEKYYEFCLERGFDEPKITSSIDSLKIFGYDRYKIVKKSCPDDGVKKWIEVNLHRNLVILKNSPQTKPHLTWGEIGENLRQGKSGLYFIDWEFSELGYGNELAYIKIHSHLSPEKFKYLVASYADSSGKSIKSIMADIDREERLTRVNDVIWAAMKWCQSKTAEDINKYKTLTYKRIGLVKNI